MRHDNYHVSYFELKKTLKIRSIFTIIIVTFNSSTTWIYLFDTVDNTVIGQCRLPTTRTNRSTITPWLGRRRRVPWRRRGHCRQSHLTARVKFERGPSCYHALIWVEIISCKFLSYQMRHAVGCVFVSFVQFWKRRMREKICWKKSGRWLLSKFYWNGWTIFIAVVLKKCSVWGTCWWEIIHLCESYCGGLQPVAFCDKCDVGIFRAEIYQDEKKISKLSIASYRIGIIA